MLQRPWLYSSYMQRLVCTMASTSRQPGWSQSRAGCVFDTPMLLWPTGGGASVLGGRQGGAGGHGR